MNFQVPQFIEVEDKIFGPLTFKQFIYLAGGAGAIFIIYTILPSLWLGIWFIVPVALLALALAFYKVNNRSFIFVLEASFRYLLSAKLYLWKRQDTTATATPIVLGAERAVEIPKLSPSKLHDLAWSLDVKENIK